jgi:hypothetical protein
VELRTKTTSQEPGKAKILQKCQAFHDFQAISVDIVLNTYTKGKSEKTTKDKNAFSSTT